MVQNYYNVFGGAAAAAAGQYPMYGGGSYTGTAAFYPYFQLGHGNSGAATYPHGQGYSLQYPHLFQYSALNSTPFPHHYGGTMSMPPPTPAGVFLFLCHFTAFLPAFLVFNLHHTLLFFFFFNIQYLQFFWVNWLGLGLGLSKTIGHVWIFIKSAGSLVCA